MHLLSFGTGTPFARILAFFLCTQALPLLSGWRADKLVGPRAFLHLRPLLFLCCLDTCRINSGRIRKK